MKWLAPVIGLALLAVPVAASASILPTLDLQRGQHIVAAGVADGNYDYALSDHQSIGLSYTFFGSTAARTTFRLGGQAGGPNWGCTLGGGTVYNPNKSYGVGPPSGIWLSPALVGTLPLGFLVLRAALGPGLVWSSETVDDKVVNDLTWWLMPNLEVAVRFNPKSELTFGGQGILGWRQAI